MELLNEIANLKSPLLFDTHNVVKSLVSSGMPMEQAEAMVAVLTRISQANAQHYSQTMVTKAHQDVVYEKVMSNINAVNKDMVILEKSEFGSLKHQFDKQHVEIEALRQHIKDELDKLKNGLSLDLNLERARSKEDHTVNEKKLSDMLNQMQQNQTENEMRDTVLEKDMESKVANIAADMERHRNDMLKYIGGTFFSLCALLLAYYRAFKDSGKSGGTLFFAGDGNSNGHNTSNEHSTSNGVS